MIEFFSSQSRDGNVAALTRGPHLRQPKVRCGHPGVTFPTPSTTGCVVVPLGETEAHEAGRLLARFSHTVGRAKTSDVVDAVVVTTALRQKATILTSDPDDIERLVRATGREVAVVAI